MKSRFFAFAAMLFIVGVVVLPSFGAGDPYIETDGSQAVNTGYFVKPKTRVEVDYAMQDLQTVQQRIFGCNGNAVCQHYINGSRGYSFALKDSSGDWLTVRPDNVQIFATGERRRFVLDAKNKLASFYTRGALVTSRTTTTVTKTGSFPLGLFTTCNNATFTAFGDQRGKLRLYSFKIYEDDVLVMELLPYREGTTYCLKDTVSGTLFPPTIGNPFTGGNLGEEDPDTVVIAPGDNVTTNGPQVIGQKNVQVNVTGCGGIVKMNPYSGYTGWTRLACGTLWADNLTGGGVGALGGSTTLVLGPGTFRYDGPDGGLWRGTITNTTSKLESTVIDAQHDLTLEGTWGWETGGFVKTGPGTLTLKSTAGVTGELARVGTAVEGRHNYQTLDLHANGDAPTVGFAKLTVAEGTLVFGGGNWSLKPSVTTENPPLFAMVGAKTVDPVDNAANAQEKEATLRVDAGTVWFCGWFGVGVKNGFSTTTPDFVPTSKLVINGGTTYITNQLVVGYNSNTITEKDAQGKWIPLRTAPRVEVHGGTFRVWGQVRMCDAPGADSTLFIDGGNLTVRGDKDVNGSHIRFAQYLNGDGTLPRHAEVTVCTNGCLDITQFFIDNDRTNVTVNLNVLDGGRFRNNQTRLANTQGRTKNCEMNLFVDGGILELRWSGYKDWLKGDITSARIGTHGATFKANGCDVNVTDEIHVSFVAADTHPDEEARGVTVSGASTYNSGFRFFLPQHWAGPTRITSNGICEMAATAAFPSGTDLTLDGTGRLVLTNGIAHAVNSFTLGAPDVGGVSALWVSPGTSIQAGSFGVAGVSSLSVYLRAAAGVTNSLTAAGTYVILSGPASSADGLREIARRTTVANPADGTDYVLDVSVDGDTASLKVTVAPGPAAVTTTKVWGNAQGGNWSEGANWTDGAEANGAGAVAAFTTEAEANGTAVTVDAAKTVGGLTFATANAYALSGSALTLANGAAPATVNVTAGGPTIANALSIVGSANLNTAGGMTLGVSGAVTGTGTLTANAGGVGSGQVTLGSALDGFNGRFTYKGGITHVSSLAFASARPNALELGWGTLDYTGTGETIAGLTLNAGTIYSSVLRIENDLTLTSLGGVAGGLIKKGAGDLIFKGNGTFAFNNFQRDYVRTGQGDPQGIRPTGEPQDIALTSMLVSEGRLVIGTKGDDSDAPHVTSPQQFQVGGRTVDWNSATNGIYETSGEVVMNNGTIDVAKVWLGYYCGMPGSVDPENLPHAKLTMNGGTINAVNFETLRDWQGYQSVQAELVQNGGVIQTTGDMTLSYQQTTNGATTTVTINDGLFAANGHIYMGRDGLSGAGTFTLNGGEVRCDYFRMGCNASSGRQVVYLNGGELKCRHLDHVGLANATAAGSAAVYFRGGVIKPGYRRNVAQGLTLGGTDGKNQFEAYVGAAGAIFDFTEWEKVGFDSGILEVRNKFLHDPECEGEDGGILLTGRNTVIVRNTSSGSTFTGPFRVANGAILGVDNGWTDLLVKRFVVEASCGLRASGGVMGFKDVTFGTAGSTNVITLDSVAGTQNAGVSASEHVAVLSPVTVSYHRNGGCCNLYGIQDGTYPVLYYKPDQEANVPLEMFVANERFPEKSFSYVKEDVASGTYSGWRVVKVTIAPTDANAAVWTSVSAGGNWSEGANWNGAEPPDGTNAPASFQPAMAAAVPVNVDASPMVGQINLRGANAAAGYSFTGGAISLNHEDFRVAPGIFAESGTHVVANDLVTDDTYYRSNETDVNGGNTGAIGIYPTNGARVTVTGTVTMDPSRPLRVNTPTSGGGTTVFNGRIAQGAGVWVNSGKLEMDDVSTLDGKTLTVGAGTFHYTGPTATTTMKLTTNPNNNNNLASILRIDGDLTVAGQFNTVTGGVMKTGPGTLTIAPGGTATTTIGRNGRNTSWNSTGADWYWPANGDPSTKQGSGSLCIDEGEVRLAGPNAQFYISNSGTMLDCFVGANDRGWGYTTNYAALTILSGTVRGPWLYLGHTFNHGKDANGHLIPTYSVYNQYGGNVTLSAFCFCYDLSDYDTACQATANLYDGTLTDLGVMRFGQTYNKTGINPPHATFNVYGGTYNHTDTSGTKGTRMGYLGDKAGGQKTLNRACDATLNMYGGNYNEIELIHMGCNASTSHLNLHGGVLKAENIILDTSTSTSYCFFSGGSAYIFWNGGVFAPVGTAAANQTLSGLTEVLVSTNGAVVTTAELAGESYTVAQPLLHDPDLEGADGGFVKKGSKPLALTGANTYTGDTVVEEGTLEIPASANASALPASSAVVVAEGATLEMASGTAARVGGLRVNMEGAGAITGFAPAAAGTLYVDGVGETERKGLVLPLTVTDAQQKQLLARWPVVIDGELDEKVCGRVKSELNKIVLEAKVGIYLFIR